MNLRKGNLEFRRLRDSRPAEIVRWSKNGDGTEYCWTILWWMQHSEGYYVEFVGRRPFDDNSDNLWELMEYGQDTLDAEFKLEERLKWK